MVFFGKKVSRENGAGAAYLDYEVEYRKEQERTAKLWKAYEEQVGSIAKLEEENRALGGALRVLDRYFLGRGRSLRKVLEDERLSEEELLVVEGVMNERKSG